MKDWKLKLLALAAIFFACFIVDMKLRGFSREAKGEDGATYISCIGEVVDIDAGRATGEPPAWTWTVDGQIVTLRILSGKYKGQEVFASNALTGEYADRVLRQGDKLYLTIPSKDSHIINTSPVGLGEYVRIPFLLYLATGFLVLMVIIGGSKGIRSSMSLIVSGVFIASLLIPMFLKGYNPVWVSILIATVNAVLTFMLVSGMTRKSLAGVLGTLGGLMTAAFLAFFSSRILHFTGLDVSFGFLDLGKRLWMASESTNWNFRGLLVSGMILGASGAIMDSSMAVASAIEEVKRANPQLGIWRCIASGLNVGKDEMGTMANTLIFAYIGADITLILMPMIQFGEAGRAYPLTRVINEEAASAEIVQALTGTIGLIMAIPITALVAGFLIGRRAESGRAKVPLSRVPRSLASSLPRLVVPFALLVIALGIHAAYIVTRRAAAVQTGEEEEQSIVSEYVRARVLEKSPLIDVPSDSAYARVPAKSEVLKVRILGGSYRNEQALVQNILDPNRVPLYNIEVKPGDEVLLKVDGTPQNMYDALIHRHSRDGFLLYLVGLFALVIVMVGRFQGIRTILALGISIIVVFRVLMPLIMAGYDPVLMVIGVSGVVAFTSLVVIAGFNRKTGAATVGILGGVIVASLIILYADHRLRFTGIFSSRTAIAAQFTVSQNLDFRKILMAGIIMGLLGTAMDAAIAVASAVREVRRANPKMTTTQLIAAGMNVGTDVLGTMANTLIFAYLGLRITLLMTLAGTHILSGNNMEVMSTETIAAEVLRILAGSIGLVLTVPITAVAAASWDRITGFLGFGGRSV
jgi:uncharacterized membrane protein